jgi:hypothetical protein
MCDSRPCPFRLPPKIGRCRRGLRVPGSADRRWHLPLPDGSSREHQLAQVFGAASFDIGLKRPAQLTFVGATSRSARCSNATTNGPPCAPPGEVGGDPTADGCPRNCLGTDTQRRPTSLCSYDLQKQPGTVPETPDFPLRQGAASASGKVESMLTFARPGSAQADITRLYEVLRRSGPLRASALSTAGCRTAARKRSSNAHPSLPLSRTPPTSRSSRRAPPACCRPLSGRASHRPRKARTPTRRQGSGRPSGRGRSSGECPAWGRGHRRGCGPPGPGRGRFQRRAAEPRWRQRAGGFLLSGRGQPPAPRSLAVPGAVTPARTPADPSRGRAPPAPREGREGPRAGRRAVPWRRPAGCHPG